MCVLGQLETLCRPRSGHCRGGEAAGRDASEVAVREAARGAAAAAKQNLSREKNYLRLHLQTLGDWNRGRLRRERRRKEIFVVSFLVAVQHKARLLGRQIRQSHGKSVSLHTGHRVTRCFALLKAKSSDTPRFKIELPLILQLAEKSCN